MDLASGDNMIRLLPREPGKNSDRRFMGDFQDGWENKFTVMAVSNPVSNHPGRAGVPASLAEKSPGYGIVRFVPRPMHAPEGDVDSTGKEGEEDAEGRVVLENWPNWADPCDPGQMYEDWPLVLNSRARPISKKREVPEAIYHAALAEACHQRKRLAHTGSQWRRVYAAAVDAPTTMNEVLQKADPKALENAARQAEARRNLARAKAASQDNLTKPSMLLGTNETDMSSWLGHLSRWDTRDALVPSAVQKNATGNQSAVPGQEDAEREANSLAADEGANRKDETAEEPVRGVLAKVARRIPLLKRWLGRRR